MWNKLKNVLTSIAQPETGKVVPINEGKTKANVKKQSTNSKKPAAPPAPVPKKPRASKKKVEDEDPDKKLATKNGEPWVKVLGIEVDESDPGQGAFELDWNDIFIAKLVRAGYQGKTDQDLVDNWFKAVCRNVVTETYEQEQADPEKRVSRRRDLGDGRTEIS